MKTALAKIVATLAVIGAILVATSGDSFAYLAIKGGFFMPNDSGLEGYDNGFNVEAAVGKVLDNAPAAIEVGAGFYRTTGSEGYVDSNVWVIPITVTAKVRLPVTEKVSVYGGGGLGLYMSQVEFSSGSRSISDDASALGLHFVGGIEFPLESPLTGLVEVKWVTFESNYRLGAASTGDQDIGGLILNVGLKF